jgi:hypothetical protein
MVLHEPVTQFGRPVQRMLPAERDDLPRNGGVHTMRASERRMGAIEQGGFAAFPKARQPLVTSLFADGKGRAHLRDGAAPIQAGTDKLEAFRHG